MSDRVLAEVHDYDQLVAAFRERVAELAVPCETVDDVAGLPVRYTQKLLSPVRVKGVGPFSLGPLLGTLGLKLLVVEDLEVLAKIIHRLAKVRNASGAMRARLTAQKPRRRKQIYVLNGNSNLARLLAQRRVLTQSPQARSAAARHAANVRWGGGKRRRRRRRGGRVSRTSRAAGPRARR